MLKNTGFWRSYLKPNKKKSYSYVKVFGERNTGTNFLNALIRSNVVDAKVLEHGNNSEGDAQIKRFPPEYSMVVDERMRDHLRMREFHENFGFKHAFVDRKRLETSPKFSDTLFLFITRNPYYFLTSLFRRPYSIVPNPAPDASFDEFLRQPILLHEREYYDYPVVESPVHLWSLKTKNVLSAHREIPNSVLLKYEDLVANPHGHLASMAEMGLKTKAELSVPNYSTKGDPLSFRDYQRRTQEYNPTDHYSRENLKFVRDSLDLDMCAQLGYIADYTE